MGNYQQTIANDQLYDIIDNHQFSARRKSDNIQSINYCSEGKIKRTKQEGNQKMMCVMKLAMTFFNVIPVISRSMAYTRQTIPSPQGQDGPLRNT
jgi:hypothetical protein